MLPSINRVSTQSTFARRARFLSSSSFHWCTSIASNRPLFPINAAKCSVLPPPPAHESTTRIPGSTCSNGAIFCDPASCTSNNPSLNGALENTCFRSLNFNAPANPLIATASISSAASIAITSSSVARVKFTRKNTGACSFIAFRVSFHAAPNSASPN